PSVERGLEQALIVGQTPDLLDYVTDRGVTHFIAREQRSPNLVLERKLASVVEQALEVGDVQDSRRISPVTAAFDAHGSTQLVGSETLFRHVAHGAGHRVVWRQSPIHEELAAEIDFRLCERVLG